MESKKNPAEVKGTVIGSKTRTESVQPKKKESCFVIMPFGGFFDSYYMNIYKPAIEAAGLRAKRVDDLYRPSPIIQDIWTHTKEAKLILADLTDKNPNVFYELGLAHALAKPAILITNCMADVPFDLKALRVIEYDKNYPDWGQRLKEKIERSIKEILESPINSVLPAFLDPEDIEKQKITITEKDFMELKRDLEILRSEVRQTMRMPAEVYIDAKKRVRKYMDAGILDADDIISRLESRGVLEEWILTK